MNDPLQNWLWFFDEDLVHTLLAVQPDQPTLSRRAASHPAIVSAMRLWLRREPARAAEVLAPALALANPDALLLAAQIAFETGDIPLAASYYSQLTESAPGHPCAVLNLGLCQARLAAYDAAAESLQRAVVLRPDLPHAWFALGVSLLHLQRPEEASAAFAQCLRLKPAYVPAACGQAAALQLRGDFTAALDVYSSLLEHAPHRAELLANAASCASSAGDWDLARLYASRLLELEPSSVAALSALAQASLAQSQFDDAARYSTALTQALPDSFDPWYHLAVALQRLDRHHDAACAFDAALQLDPSVFDAWHGLAQSLALSGDSAAAKAAWRDAVRHHPGSRLAWLHAGLLHAADTETALAQDAVDHALALPADDGQAGLCSELCAALAALYHQDGLCERAAALYRLALESAPDSPETLFNLGSALASLGRIDEAQSYWKRALSLDATLAPLLLDLLGARTLAVS